MGKKTLDPDTIKQIKALRRSGEQVAEIAKYLKVSYSTAYRYSAGIKPKKAKKLGIPAGNLTQLDYEVDLAKGTGKGTITDLGPDPLSTKALAELAEAADRSMNAKDNLTREDDDLHEIVQACNRIIRQRVLKEGN